MQRRSEEQGEDRGTAEPVGDRGGASLVVFSIGGRRYALDLDRVERVVRMVAITPLPDAPDGVLGAINVHGRAIPVVDLARRLGHGSIGEDPDVRLVLARTAERTVALPVDDVLGAVEAPRAAVVSADAVAPGLTRLAAVVADADGLVLIHDVDGLVSLEEHRQLDAALEGSTR